MNCWFCNSHTNYIDNPDPYKEYNCVQCKVKYKFTSNSLNIVQFKTKLNNRSYIINYWVQTKMLVVVEQTHDIFTRILSDPFEYNVILEIPCEHYPITPQNVNEKLPLFLLFT